jgi:SAM-dependent methyltransferase
VAVNPASYAMPLGSSDRWPDDYERGRPGWPTNVVNSTGLDTEATVLEVAAGTGKLTRLLLGTFSTVVAVEPSLPMQRLLREFCHGALTLAGTVEEIPLAEGSVDGVFVAEAFHKFDGPPAVAELARVLRPDGTLILMWNVPAGPTEPSIEEAERFLIERAPKQPDLGYDPTDLATSRFVSGAWRAPFQSSPFEEFQEIRFSNPQTIDRDGLIAFFASMGWIADLPDTERLPLLEEVRSLLTADEYHRRWMTRLYSTRRGR